MKRIPREYVKCAVVMAGLGIVAVFLIAASGLYSIAASRGHWAPVEWFLEFGLRRSAATHTIGIQTPTLDDPAMIAAGMGHYEIACASCHGAPGRPPNPLTQTMLPPPPYLPDRVLTWKPKELFWITKNGLKYTGMPGWTAPDRDDEVWSVIAALLRMPGMDAPSYQSFIESDTPRGPEDEADSMRRFITTGPPGESLVACARCHGIDGAGGGAGSFPRLAGQSRDYLLHALNAYADGTRPSGMMQPIAAAVTPEDRARLATYYAAMSAPATRAAAADAGARLAATGDPARGIAACDACHATDGISPLYPRLAGQHAWYLRQQLTLWRDGKRGGTPLSEIMAAAVRGISEADIAAAAAHYAALPPP